MRNKFILIFVLLISAGLCVAGNKDNNAPIRTDNTISFQGYLTDAGGRPYFGNVYMDFVFYDTATPNEDVTENETHMIVKPGGGMTRPVAVYNGLYATKMAVTGPVLSHINANKDVWVEVYVSRTDPGKNTIITPNNVMLPRVQLNAASYALAVKGLYFNETTNTLKIGEGFQSVNANASGGLVISGNVGIGVAIADTNMPVSTNTARLVLGKVFTTKAAAYGKDMYVSGDMTVVGSIVTKDDGATGTASQSDWGVHGAVWN